jgi:hypothetical protein
VFAVISLGRKKRCCPIETIIMYAPLKEQGSWIIEFEDGYRTLAKF